MWDKSRSASGDMNEYQRIYGLTGRVSCARKNVERATSDVSMEDSVVIVWNALMRALGEMRCAYIDEHEKCVKSAREHPSVNTTENVITARNARH